MWLLNRRFKNNVCACFLEFPREMIYQYKCRVLPLKKAAEKKIQEQRAAAVSSFKSMLRDSGDINTSSRWSRVGALVRAYLT